MYTKKLQLLIDDLHPELRRMEPFERCADCYSEMRVHSQRKQSAESERCDPPPGCSLCGEKVAEKFNVSAVFSHFGCFCRHINAWLQLKSGHKLCLLFFFFKDTFSIDMKKNIVQIVLELLFLSGLCNESLKSQMSDKSFP